MKVILSEDVKHLGEMGDVKTVANGYARNYLFPRNFALPYNDATIAWFDSRKEEIEARKQAKREQSAGLKERLDAHTVTIVMSAGENGKLYGAVTSQTVAEALAKDGFEIERKRIEIPGATIKNTGKYTATVRLYEAQTAELSIVVEAQAEPEKKSEDKSAKKPRRNERAEQSAQSESAAAENGAVESDDASNADGQTSSDEQNASVTETEQAD